MRLKFSLLAIAVMYFGAANVFAQNEMDAFRYSGYTSGGTARALGMAGAFSAVGADFTAAWLNPAGLALYRRKDFEFTPTLRFINNDANYSGLNSIDKATNLGISNAGYVYAAAVKGTQGKDSKDGFKSFAFSLGFNQTNNYWRNTALSAFNPKNSITEFFAGAAEGYSQADLQNDRGYPGQAYAAGLLLPDTSGSLTHWLPGIPGGNIQQNIQIIEKGRTNEWNIGIAGNVGDLIYIGGSLGLMDVRYSNELYYQEQDVSNLHTQWTADSTNFSSLDFFDYYRTKGSGLNARIGVIVRPADFLRISLAAQSPTWLNLTDNYYSDLSAIYDGDGSKYGLNRDQLGEGRFTYNLTTPYKVTAGVMVLFKKLGFVTADADISDYSTASFSSDNSPLSGNFVSFASQNSRIRQLFDFAYNFRLGAEARLSMFRFRGGFAYYGSVLKPGALQSIDLISGNPVTINGGRMVFSGGFGIKMENVYIDLAIVRDIAEDRRIFYTIETPNSIEPELVNKRKSTSSVLTIGFTF